MTAAHGSASRFRAGACAVALAMLPLLLATPEAIAAPVGAASPPKAIDSDPVSLITAIYETYLDNTELLTDIYSKRLQALLDKDAQETPEGMVGRIDWDVFVDGQDFTLKELKIVPVSLDDTKRKSA
jgi:hypothetical protein